MVLHNVLLDVISSFHFCLVHTSVALVNVLLLVAMFPMVVVVLLLVVIPCQLILHNLCGSLGMVPGLMLVL